MRLKVSTLLALVLVASLSVGLMADVAAAKPSRAHKMSAKHKRLVRAKLRKQIRKNPAVIKRKSFLRKAALVNFKLPVTLRLRGAGNGVPQNNTSNGNALTPGANPNRANVDLGASLGSRTLGLGGSLTGEITFHDSFDGGALGNVSIDLRPDQSGGKNHTLSSTSIPLLWNNQVTSPRFDSNDLGIPDAAGLSGCSDLVSGGNASPTGNGMANAVTVSSGFTTLQGFINALDSRYIAFGSGYTGVGNTNGLPGYPISGGPTTEGYIGIVAGLDDINNVKAGDIPGNDDVVGPSTSPFPTSPNYVAPGGFTQPPDVRNTVLRTNALSLNIADAGTPVNLSGPGFNNAEGSQNIVIGKSGGEANLFGNIPGKSYGIDVTASFVTKINSIIRVVDQDSFHTGLQAGGDWPAGVFNCRQVWTGYVDNYIPGVRLKGNLKIAPGLTYDGHLRIAKATVSSDIPARFAVAACLSPSANYAAGLNGSDTAPGYKVPASPTGGLYPTSAGLAGATQGPILDTSYLPLQEFGKRPLTDPFVNAACDSTRTYLVQNSNYGGSANFPFNVGALTGGTVNDGYTTSASGAKVSVAADLNVTNVALDVLIGDV